MENDRAAGGLQARFIGQFCTHMRYDPDEAVQAAVDPSLSIYYPLLVRRGCGRTVYCVARELRDALDTLGELPPDMPFADVMGVLFDDGIVYEQERSFIGVHDAASFTPLPAVPGAQARPLDASDGRLLRRFQSCFSRTERAVTRIRARDEYLTGVFAGGELVSAASAERWGELMDISVMTLDGRRGMGYGAFAVSELCRAVTADGLMAQYRCDEANPASAALMRTLGFVPVMELTGALLHLGEG